MGVPLGRLDMPLKTSQQRLPILAGAVIMALIPGCTDSKPATSVLHPASTQIPIPAQEKERTTSIPQLPPPTQAQMISKSEAQAQAPATQKTIVPTIQRLRGEQVERFHVSRGTRFITLAGKGGVIQTIDGLRGRIIAERRIAPEILCDGNAVSTDGRQILTRRGRRVQMTNVFDGKVSYLGEPHASRPRCTLDGDGLRVVELTKESARITHFHSQKVTSLPAPETGRIRRILADRTARVIVADATTDERDVWLVFGGGGGTFWRALDRTRGGSSMAISESGRWFITAYGEKQLQQWDLDSDQVVATWPFRKVYQFQGHDERVLVETNTDGLALVDRASGEIVAQWGIFRRSYPAVDIVVYSSHFENTLRQVCPEQLHW